MYLEHLDNLSQQVLVYCNYFTSKLNTAALGIFLRTLKQSQKFKFALIYINSLKNDSFEILQWPF